VALSFFHSPQKLNGKFNLKLLRAITPVDILLFLIVFLLIYGLVSVAHEWTGPYRPRTEIDLGLGSLLKYSMFSLVRVFIAYGLSLAFTFVYGYAAAKSKVAEPILISLLDILQSVPVLGFMPGLVLALVQLFPGSNIGLELATVIMIFTCEGWNMVFSFYSSLKAVPSELKEMSSLFGLKKMDLLRKIEIPFAMNGLLWNSMLSMAGGWFYLMVMESFTLGDKDFRLPGIGSYVTVAYERHDTSAILSGIGVMFGLIAVVDRCLWAPLVVWSERFRYDPGSLDESSHSVVLELLRRSKLLPSYMRKLKRFQGTITSPVANSKSLLDRIPTGISLWGRNLLLGAGLLILIWGLVIGARGSYILLSATHLNYWIFHLRDTFYTFLRVAAAVILGSLWTIPVGVFIGINPIWTRRLQPVVQIIASFPAPMLFPILTLFLIKSGIGLEIGAVLLMLFASQWYILFNVISGATRIPKQMLDVGKVFRLKGFQYWRSILLPAVFPSLVNGWITAAGGAWNACIVTEYVSQGKTTLMATGIGASISSAAQEADFPKLAGAIFIMVLTVVLLNRFFWGALYRLAETRFRLEY
jgi:NitT/TauT family transport system permease protein